MRFAYADPPYLGSAVKHYGKLHAEAAVYDTIEGHRELIDGLAKYDGWALSMGSNNLRDLLPLCPADCRVLAWIKPFAAFKANVGVAYAWEPVIVRGARKRTRQQETVRDWLAESITLRRGLTGAKPRKFVLWLLEVLNVQRGDEVDDIFHGSGGVASVLNEWHAASRGEQVGLFAKAEA